MARPATGQILEHRTKAGEITRTLRFVVNGERRRQPLGVVSHDEAERQLRHVLSDVERGVWTPPKPAPPSPTDTPLFGDFADEWWKRRKAQLAPKTQADYRWRLEVHLLPEFEDVPLDAITVDAIDRYVSTKLEQGLSPRSVNMTVTILGAILDSAQERELIARNAARGRNRRAKERKPARSDLEGERDARAQEDKRHVHRRAMLAVLIFAGLRRNEMLALRWRDVDLAGGWLAVRESKTDAGVRKVKIRGALRDEFLAIKPADSDQHAYVFPSRTGGRISPENFRNRILTTALERAREELAKRDLPPLPELVTSHSLRRTFASVLYAVGEDPGTVMDELGQTDPALALRIYRQAMRRGEHEKATLAALVEGGGSSPTGQPALSPIA